MDLSTVAGLIALIFVAMFTIKVVMRSSSYKETEAIVVELDVCQRNRPDDQSTYTAYVPIYEYVVDNNKYSVRGAAADHITYNVGDKRMITYNVKNPSEAHLRVSNHKHNNIGKGLMVVGVIIVIISVLFVIFKL